MKDRIDMLIAERAPWLYSGRLGTAIARRCMLGMLGYQTTVDVAESFRHAPSEQIMSTMAKRVARMVEVQGLGHIPAHGPALIVANHPTGIADAIILNGLIADARPDTYFFANRDIVRLFPQMETMIAPVEWRSTLRTLAKTRETMIYVRNATNNGRLGVIFPSGRLAKRRGLHLYERPWMVSAAMLARKFDLPVIPVNIQARNSALFYLFDFIHPTLRDITLFHEMFNKARQPFKVTVGEPISAASIPRNSEDGIEMLRNATLALGGKHAPAVNLVSTSRMFARLTPTD